MILRIEIAIGRYHAKLAIACHWAEPRVWQWTSFGPFFKHIYAGPLYIEYQLWRSART